MLQEPSILWLQLHQVQWQALQYSKQHHVVVQLIQVHLIPIAIVIHKCQEIHHARAIIQSIVKLMVSIYMYLSCKIIFFCIGWIADNNKYIGIYFKYVGDISRFIFHFTVVFYFIIVFVIWQDFTCYLQLTIYNTNSRVLLMLRCIVILYFKYWQ